MGLAMRSPCARSFSSTADYKFTKTHEYVSGVKGGVASFGITQYAAKELGDIVYCELPDKGKKFKQGEVVASVESVKAAGSVYAPVDVEVTDVNSALSDSPQLINENAFEKGWIFKGKVSNPKQLDALLNDAAYKKLLDAEHK